MKANGVHGYITEGCNEVCSVHFSPFYLLGRREHEGWFSRDPLPVFSAGDSCEQFCHGRGCPLFDVIHPAFPLPTTASPTLQGALKNGFREAFVACDMPEPRKFPSLRVCGDVGTWWNECIHLYRQRGAACHESLWHSAWMNDRSPGSATSQCTNIKEKVAILVSLKGVNSQVVEKSWCVES